MSESTKPPSQTVLMFTTFDPTKFEAQTLGQDDLKSEYVKAIGVGEHPPSPGDYLLYNIDGELVVRQVVHRVFTYASDVPGAMMLFVK